MPFDTNKKIVEKLKKDNVDAVIVSGFIIREMLFKEAIFCQLAHETADLSLIYKKPHLSVEGEIR